MTRYVLRALASEWRFWVGTLVVLAFAATLVNVCLVHRYSVTRPEIISLARASGVGPGELEASGVSIYVYSSMVAIPVVAIVGQSCVQALRTSWAKWRLAGALPRQVFISVIVIVAILGILACLPGVILGSIIDQPISSVLTRIATQKMGNIEVVQTYLSVGVTIISVVGIAVLGAIGPALSAIKVPATEAVREANSHQQRKMGITRWIFISVWALGCIGQFVIAIAFSPLPSNNALPEGGGQSMMASMLLAILIVLAAPSVIPPLLRTWSAPWSRMSAIWMIARRSAAWRSTLTSSAIALLSLGMSFTAALMTNVYTSQAVVAAANLPKTVNQLDTLVMAAILGLLSLLGAIAVISMNSRDRKREFAILRCAGITESEIRRQTIIEAFLYTGTAFLLSLIPLTITAIGEASFYYRAGLPFELRPAFVPLATVLIISFISLLLVLTLPSRKAYQASIGPILADD